MGLAQNLTRLAILPLALLLVGAAPAAKVIPYPKADGEALIVPADSPVKFRSWDEYGSARFEGRFVLTGTFTYGCSIECPEAGPFKESDLEVVIAPDPELAERLPKWKIHGGGDMALFISRDARLARSIGDRKERAALFAGQIPYLEGQVTIVVDEFWTGLECDGASIGARFVSVAEAPKVAQGKFGGVAGCGG